MSVFTGVKNQIVSQVEILAIETCYQCHILFAMPKSLQDKALAEKGLVSFYCPNGHGQHYKGKSDAELLKEAREQEERLRQSLRSTEDERDHHWTERKKATTRLRNIKTRIKNGVCPCCNRTFQNLQLHIKSKHPGFNQSVPSVKSVVKK